MFNSADISSETILTVCQVKDGSLLWKMQAREEDWENIEKTSENKNTMKLVIG